MKILPRLAAAAALWLAALAPALAAPDPAAASFSRNGAVSRHVWTPGFARIDAGGLQLSTGVAIGLRGAVQTHLDRRVAPAVTWHMGQRSQLSLLAGGNRGAMLVWQRME